MAGYTSEINLKQKEIKISNLRKELDKALKIQEEKLAGRIKAIGFKCKKCAQCCKAQYGDNTVIVFPSEINKISEKTGLSRDDFVMPTPSEDRDSGGNIHTFEWVLKKNCDCIFLKNDLCKIYDCRPYICSTYPFYIVNGTLEISGCIGIGGNISTQECLMLAALLKERYINEIRESIALLERFNGFNPDGSGNVCVHDSEGEHWIH